MIKYATEVAGTAAMACLLDDTQIDASRRK